MPPATGARFVLPVMGSARDLPEGMLTMAKGQLKSNKEAKKPKKEKPKVLATAGMAATAPNTASRLNDAQKGKK